MATNVTDEAFDAAGDVGSIRYRLHPLDVGFDLRTQDMPVAIDAADDPIRVSYPAADHERRVMAGPQSAVLARLRKLGFRFVVQS